MLSKIFVFGLIIIVMLSIYLIGHNTEGFCKAASEMEIFDIMSLSYRCVQPDYTADTIPKCISGQTLMMAGPKDTVHCGTIKGDTLYASNCVINTQDASNYTLMCPEFIPGGSSKQPDTSSSVPYDPPKTDEPSTYSNVDKLDIGKPTRPVFGPRYQTIVSNLIIQSKPSPCTSSSTADTSKATPSNIKYDETSTSTSKGSDTQNTGNSQYTSVDGSSSSSYTIGTDQYIPVSGSSSIDSPLTQSTYKSAGPVNAKEKKTTLSTFLDAILPPEKSPETSPSKSSGSSIYTTSTSSGIHSNTYSNVPFPYMPTFKV